MRRNLSILVILALVMSILPMSVINASAAGTTITVESVTAEPGESVSVPIQLTDNTGICGATISIKYDSDLTLTSVSKGTALQSLTMTPPGSMSANPIVINWDGLDQDSSNGTMAVLTFTAPEKGGTYDISVLFDDGDIVDGNLMPVDVALNQGHIKVASSEAEKFVAENIGAFTADEDYEGTALEATAFKAELGTITGTLSFIVTPENGEAKTFEDSAHITDANIVLGIIVSGLADENATCEITVK